MKYRPCPVLALVQYQSFARQCKDFPSANRIELNLINVNSNILSQTYIATRYGSNFCTTDWCRTIYSMYIAQQLMKKLFSIMKKLSAKRFAELHSDWPILLFGSQALSVRGHKLEIR